MMEQRVPWIQEGTSRRPDVPEGASYSVIEDHGDGTVTVKVREDAAKAIAELRAAVDTLVLDALMGGS